MITIQEAFSLLQLNLPIKSTISIDLVDAFQHVLAQDVYAPICMPPFRQSAMDGYAINLNDLKCYEIIGEIKAGDAIEYHLNQGQAVKIFTGAPVPNTANAVVPIEKVSIESNTIFVDSAIVPNQNIRPLGEQNQKGDLILTEGTVLNAAAIGYLAGLGIHKVKVYKKPRIGIVVTGNELVTAGETLPFGKIYESNAIMLQTALKEHYFESIKHYRTADNLNETKSVLKEAVDQNDFVLISGGISVGDYDFVAQALDLIGVETLFHKVRQKPGKPLYAGLFQNKLVFALPGNPAAALSCFYIYALPSLFQISGQNLAFGTTITKKLSHDFEIRNARNQFLKAKVDGAFVTILSHQNSSMLNTFALSNALVYVENGDYIIKQNQNVEVYMLS